MKGVGGVKGDSVRMANDILQKRKKGLLGIDQKCVVIEGDVASAQTGQMLVIGDALLQRAGAERPAGQGLVAVAALKRTALCEGHDAFVQIWVSFPVWRTVPGGGLKAQPFPEGP